nr:small membrane protein YoaI [uncultured Enterobacter sp.]
MNDPMLIETLVITSTFLTIIAVLVVSVFILERTGWQ